LSTTATLTSVFSTFTAPTPMLATCDVVCVKPAAVKKSDKL
jgi:hypothetical protein